MLSLGCVDAEVSDDQCAAYLREVKAATGLAPNEVVNVENNQNIDRVQITKMAPANGAMTVAQIQRALTQIGFFPNGRADGIFGYRTQSALRLFQEYVRSVENFDAVTPDGRYGPQTHEHLQRWLASGLQPNWQQRAGEYESWLAFLETVKAARTTNPGPLLEKVNAFTQPSDTHKVSEWDFGADKIHLIGVRRDQFHNRSDDIFVLLMKGLVFKFQGSTDPGDVTDNPNIEVPEGGTPYLVPGQHDYKFGWHQQKYLALKPAHYPNYGVLVIRSGADGVLKPADDYGKPLATNISINVHWGGKGLDGFVESISLGCQIISGSLYINPANELVDCRRFAAARIKDPHTKPNLTRGAYNVARDLIVALSGDLPGGDRVKYTLLEESDLALAPEIAQSLADARARVMEVAT